MSTRAKLLSAIGVILVLGLTLHLSCVDGGGGPIVAQFTIGGQTFTFTLGTTGIFTFRAGDPPQQNAGVVKPLFNQTPSDTPSTATLALNPNDVDVIPLGTGKFQPTAQGITGSAQLLVYIASASSATPCTEGVLIGTFGLTITDGVVSIDQASLDIPPEAMPFVLSGTFSICLELTATVDLQLTITEMGITYGTGAPPSTFTLTTSVEGNGSVELSPPGGSYEEGTEVTVTATADPDWLFSYWEGDLEGTDNPGTISMDGDKTITAVLLLPDRLFDEPADFEEGTLVGLTFDAAAGGLQISAESNTRPFIWVPNSNEGTISVVDTLNGNELGRYRVCPADITGDPSRTTVDLDGSCYVANRNTGTVVKVGLYDSKTYIDRNGNEAIETSTDVNGDGDITGEELLAWGEDECVLWETVLTTEDEGPYVPGTYPGTYPYGHWDPGTRSIAVDAINNVWVGVYGTHMFYYLAGDTGEILRKVDVSSVGHKPYGGVIDGNGIMWSSGQNGNHVLRLDPSDDSFTTIAPGHFVYGLGVDRNNHLFVSGYSDSKLSRINVVTGEVEWTVDGVNSSRGVVVTDDGDVWVADTEPGTVTRWSNDGEIKATISVGTTPTGVTVDSEQKVWVVNFGDEYIKRIDPATNEVDLEKALIGTRHYGYSDMTGIVARSVSTQIGNWTVDHGSAEQESIWDTVGWGSEEPEGTAVTVRVRTSDDQVIWSDWVEVANGADLAGLPPGRYLQIEATLQILSGDLSPLLEYLAVFTED